MYQTLIIVLASLILALAYAILMYFFLRRLQVKKTQIRMRLQRLIDDLNASAVSPMKRETASPKDVQPAAIQLFVDTPLYDSLLKPLLARVQKLMLRFAPQEIYAMIEHRIVLAGKQDIWKVNHFAIAWMISVFLCTLMAVLMIQNLDLQYFRAWLASMLGAVIGGYLPFLYMNVMIRKRQTQIWRQMPSVLDLLSVSMQAGLSFDAAVAKLISHMKGPMIDEFYRMQQDMRIGITRRRALEAMADRCGMEEVHLFISSVVQSDQLGTSLTRTMVAQADNIRDIYRQYIKAEALKAPLKLLFPLIVFIFPPIFVVVLLPPILTLMDSFIEP